MDYIQSKILKNIELLKEKNSAEIHSPLAQYYRMLFEYHLKLAFACVWARKESEIPIEMRREILNKMQLPTLGVMLNFIMRMNEIGQPVFDLTPEYEKVLRESIEKRNKNFGHGIVIPYLHEKSYLELWRELEEIYFQLAEFEEKIWGATPEFFMRADSERLICFLPQKGPEYRTVEKKFAAQFRQNSLYFNCERGNFEVSPFVIVNQRNGVNFDFYYFTEYKLPGGEFNYYLVSESSDNYELTRTYADYFSSYRRVRNGTICRANGVISNNFGGNCDFVNIQPFWAYAAQIWDFLAKNQSTVCMTIRGVGGTGKTALVRYICEKYIFEPLTATPQFNFVIFGSAKDREFKLNAMTERGQIYAVDSSKIVRTYEDLLQVVGRVLNLDSAENVEAALLETTGVLLIVDDFETLDAAEKNKIAALIYKMQSDRHKVLITTRGQFSFGADCNISPLNPEQIFALMKSRFENVNSNAQQFAGLLNKNAERIYEITRGLPLLAIQLATLLPKTGFSEKLLAKNFNDAEEFLLGRLYQYFGTPTSKLLCAIIAFFAKFGRKKIFVDELQPIYETYCRRLENFDADFANDLEALKSLNVIQTAGDSLQVDSQISPGIFDRCAKTFLREYNAENLFDERIFKAASESEFSRGILQPAPKILDAETESSVAFAAIYEALEKILDEVDAALAIKTRSLKEERFQDLRVKISRLCNLDLRNALENFSQNDRRAAQNVKDLLDEISKTKPLSCTGNENYKILSEFLR